MKITKKQLRQIIKETVTTLNEVDLKGDPLAMWHNLDETKTMSVTAMEDVLEKYLGKQEFSIVSRNDGDEYTWHSTSRIDPQHKHVITLNFKTVKHGDK